MSKHFLFCLSAAVLFTILTPVVSGFAWNSLDARTGLIKPRRVPQNFGETWKWPNRTPDYWPNNVADYESSFREFRSSLIADETELKMTKTDREFQVVYACQEVRFGFPFRSFKSTFQSVSKSDGTKFEPDLSLFAKGIRFDSFSAVPYRGNLISIAPVWTGLIGNLAFFFAAATLVLRISNASKRFIRTSMKKEPNNVSVL